MPDTIAYYNNNAEAFFSDTVCVDMSDLHRRFLKEIPAGGLILDAGWVIPPFSTGPKSRTVMQPWPNAASG